MWKVNAKKNFRLEGFPQVWKNSQAGYVTIIYRNRTELYKLERTYNNTDAKKINDSTFDPYNEIEMEKGNGSRRVFGNKETEFVMLRGDKKE